jgi:hypothetical protein
VIAIATIVPAGISSATIVKFDFIIINIFFGGRDLIQFKKRVGSSYG